jgi:hypothetical protein
MAELEARIRLEGDRSTEGGNVGLSKGFLKDLKVGFKAALGATGLLFVVELLVSLLTNLKSLTSVISGLFKLISLLLSPIADVVIVFLTPILLILKPIVNVINQVMLPFFKQAMVFMREGVAEGDPLKIAAGAQTILLGLGAVITTLSAGIIKLIGDIFLTGIAEIVGIFSLSGKETILNEIIPAFDNFMNDITAVGVSAFGAQVIALGERVGSDTTVFQNDFLSMIQNVFSVDEDMTKAIDESFNTVRDEGIIKGMAELLEATGLAWDSFKSDGELGIDNFFKAIFDAIDTVSGFELPSFGNAEDNNVGFFQKFTRAGLRTLTGLVNPILPIVLDVADRTDTYN